MVLSLAQTWTHGLKAQPRNTDLVYYHLSRRHESELKRRLENNNGKPLQKPDWPQRLQSERESKSGLV